MKTAMPPSRTAGGGLSRRGWLIVAFVVLVLAVLLKGCFFRESDYERIAKEVTIALQRDDLPAVLKYQNAETATSVNRERVGRAADALAPLGGFKSIKETKVDPATRIHEFDLTFDKGSVHETIKFDPEKRIVRFHYDPPQKK
jgi:hypothetical protein